MTEDTRITGRLARDGWWLEVLRDGKPIAMHRLPCRSAEDNPQRNLDAVARIVARKMRRD